MEDIMQINLGSIEQILPGYGRAFRICDTEVAIVRTRTNQIFALENRCPHRQGPLSDGIIGNGKIVCPLHGHKFDLKSGQGEGHECVKTFKVAELDGNMILEYVRPRIQEELIVNA